MSAALKVEGIPGWKFHAERDPAFQYLDEPHHYLLRARLWSPTLIFRQVNYITDEEIRWWREEHRYRGKYVHQARHFLDEGDLILNDPTACLPEFRGYLDAWLDCKRIWKIIVRLSEVPIYHRTKLYGVTPDTEILIDGEPGIGEVKTGHMPWWARFQTAAQDEGIGSWDARKVQRRRIGIQLGPTGKFRVIEFDDPDDYHIWNAALISQQARGAPDATIQEPFFANDLD